MLFLRGIDADSSPVSQKEIKDTKENHSKSNIKMQFPFQLEVHIGAYTLLCALRLLAFLKLALRVLSPKLNIHLQRGAALQVFSLLHSCITSIRNQFDLRQGFQLKPWKHLVYMFKPTKRCYSNVVLLVILPGTTELSN